MNRSISNFVRFPRIFALASTAKMGASKILVTQQIHSMRTIFTTQSRFGSSNVLVVALEEEIREEKALEQDKLGGSSSPTIAGFKISSEEGVVRLNKTQGAEKIEVCMNVKHSVDIEQDEFEDEEHITEEKSAADDVESVPVALPSFSISITKGSQSLWFQLDMVKTEEGNYDFTVVEFYIAPAKDGLPIDVNDDMHDKVYASSGKYIDSNVHDLLFVKYLEERGFTSEFCHQLVDFATHHEHKLYVGLLEKIKKFVEK